MNKTYRWSDIFQRQHVIKRLQAGPFGAYLDEFTTALRNQHYSPITMQRSICSADLFGRWLGEQSLTWADANETTVSRYHDALGRCAAGGCPHRVQGLRLAVGFLQQKGIAAWPSDSELRCSPIEEWLGRFEGYLERVVGAQASTRQRYRPILLRFLKRRFDSGEPDWSVLSADDLTAFIQHEAAHAKGFGRKVPGVALRSLLRFLVSQGLVRDGLAAAIPSPRQHLHATLPTRATAEEVGGVLGCCQDGTLRGLRDHAVLLLLVRLGLRAREVAFLTLDDLDWQQGIVCIRAGKTRRERILPLPPEVGAALALYLKHARPLSPERTVFLQAQPPHRPWCGASAVSQLVRRRLLQSGFPATPWRGAHLFRHTAASQMVNGGASFKEVADVLGHQSLTTTSLYAKLNLETLAAVALPWQGGQQ